MPSTSRAQHNLMEGVAHNPAFAAKVGIAQKVGKDFVAADQAADQLSQGGPAVKKKSGLSQQRIPTSGGSDVAVPTK